MELVLYIKTIIPAEVLCRNLHKRSHTSQTGISLGAWLRQPSDPQEHSPTRTVKESCEGHIYTVRAYNIIFIIMATFSRSLPFLLYI